MTVTGSGKGVIRLLAMTLLLGACSDEEPISAPDPTTSAEAATMDTVGTFTLKSSTCAYEGPGKIPEGEVSFSLLSEGGPADFDLWKLDEGHDYEELVAHIAEEVRRQEEGLPGLGHPDFAKLVAEASTDGEGDGKMTTSVDVGQYGMACIRFEGDRTILAAGPFEVEPVT